jgi:hypothetical protein
MAGWFDMPTWGMMAANPTQPLTQEDLMVGRTDLPPPSEPEPAPAPVAPPQGDPVTAAKRYMAWRRANSLNSLSNKGGIPYGNDNDMSYERYLSQLDYWN